MRKPSKTSKKKTTGARPLPGGKALERIRQDRKARGLEPPIKPGHAEKRKKKPAGTS